MTYKELQELADFYVGDLPEFRQLSLSVMHGLLDVSRWAWRSPTNDLVS